MQVLNKYNSRLRILILIGNFCLLSYLFLTALNLNSDKAPILLGFYQFGISSLNLLLGIFFSVLRKKEVSKLFFIASIIVAVLIIPLVIVIEYAN